MSNNDLAQRSRSAVWHPCTQMKTLETLPPLAIRQAEGVWLHDYDGHRYLDATSAWWVNLFGHRNPRINAALKAQLDTLEHVMLAGCTHEPVVALSEKLARLTGLGHAFYGSDGASATEIALKMSFHFWRNRGLSGKNRFVSLQHGYHGETVGALAVTDIPIFRDTYAPLLRASAQVPSPDWRLAESGESPQDYALRCAQALDDYLAAHHAEIAAVILEPLVQGAAGMAMYHADYLLLARQSCNRYQVHLIADEIAVGFGRTGTMFACEQAGITPDFICLSKGLTGGYLPLSAVLTTNAVYECFYDDATARGFLHSHSYTGNALACRAALATLEIFEQDNVLVANRAKQVRMNAALQPLRELPIAHPRNTGMIWAFDVPDAPADFPRHFYQQALAHGLLLRPLGNTVYFMPPYVISDAEIDWLAERIILVMKKVTT
ncbi:MAG: adenosylmethionine--8-amino-7-oxononanoate transaminase [Methylobacillus sp.]|jgi:adenosylmethionine-8-amino-7-oxononanoate aminotransferase|nr:adenosylmethionine--8-amino-7-oxononanoate transaminase [Methylobacillus sp.]